MRHTQAAALILSVLSLTSTVALADHGHRGRVEQARYVPDDDLDGQLAFDVDFGVHVGGGTSSNGRRDDWDDDHGRGRGKGHAKHRHDRGHQQAVANGWVREYHPNGALAFEGWFRNGVPDGRMRQWFANGVLAFDGYYRAGVLDGRVRRYHANGALAEDVYVRNGRADGMLRRYHPNGQLRAQGYVRNGVRDGQWTTWYVNGGIHSDGWFRDGTFTVRSSGRSPGGFAWNVQFGG